jgi:hypothetical protein
LGGEGCVGVEGVVVVVVLLAGLERGGGVAVGVGRGVSRRRRRCHFFMRWCFGCRGCWARWRVAGMIGREEKDG